MPVYVYEIRSSLLVRSPLATQSRGQDTGCACGGLRHETILKDIESSSCTSFFVRLLTPCSVTAIY